MIQELKMLGIKFLILLVISPILGLVFLPSAELFEKAWKSNDRKKKWMAVTGLFVIVAVIGGWLH